MDRILGRGRILMLAVGLSYRQTIRAYPHGGGSYIVATDNMGRIAGLAAAAGLNSGYILTVTVPAASGWAAVTSALPAQHRLRRSARCRAADLALTVIVPELAVRHWWQRSLHEHTAWGLTRALQPLGGSVVTSVRFHLPS